MYQKGQNLVCYSKPTQYYTVGKIYGILEIGIIDNKTMCQFLNNKGIINWFNSDIVVEHFVTEQELLREVRKRKLLQLG